MTKSREPKDVIAMREKPCYAKCSEGREVETIWKVRRMKIEAFTYVGVRYLRKFD